MHRPSPTCTLKYYTKLIHEVEVSDGHIVKSSIEEFTAKTALKGLLEKTSIDLHPKEKTFLQCSK